MLRWSRARFLLLPASVVAIASVIQAWSGCARPGTTGRKSSTAGTLETRLESTTATTGAAISNAARARSVRARTGRLARDRAARVGLLLREWCRMERLHRSRFETLDARRPAARSDL